MWVDVSCPRCSHNQRINGCGLCRACKAFLIWRPSDRVRKIDLRGKLVAFQWHPDDDGSETVHPDNGATVTQERGLWIRLQGDTVEFVKPDRRSTARAKDWWAGR
jgi:hypothetical protein